MTARDNPESEVDAGPLWALGSVGAIGAALWFQRDRLLAALEPPGITAADLRPFHGDGLRPDVVTEWRPTGGYHVTGLGWVAAAALLVGVAAAAVLGAAALRWVRWHRGGGVDAVPPVPAAAAAAFAAAVGFLAPLVVRSVPAPLAAAVAVAAGIAAWPAATRWGEQRRALAAFAARADQVLGHGHPAPGRVRATAWRAGHPRRIALAAGPGWQDQPAEYAELGRYAHAVGWPRYEWTFDGIARAVVGTTDGDDT